MNFRGVGTALVTPFTESGALETARDRIREHLERTHPDFGRFEAHVDGVLAGFAVEVPLLPGHGTRWRRSRCRVRVRLTWSSSRRIRAIRSRISRRSASIWVSPGPPRKPKPPRCRSRWVQLRTSRPA